MFDTIFKCASLGICMLMFACVQMCLQLFGYVSLCASLHINSSTRPQSNSVPPAEPGIKKNQKKAALLLRKSHLQLPKRELSTLTFKQP